MKDEINKETRARLEEFAKEIIPTLKSLSKGFAPSIEYKINDVPEGVQLQIFGHQHILTLIYGRGATKNTSGGTPPLKDLILMWVKKHNVVFTDLKGERMKDEVTAFLITRKVHREGTVLYREIQNGKQPVNIFDEVLNEKRIEKLLNNIKDDYFSLISYSIDTLKIN